ncbi:hypothetical protein SUDANB5_00871 [Streptomyces sp. SudanB5_2050]|uniref:hypothetical protein n=1 Tax=Streptomyces sp. SudanB5_2050 TaxID=3035274 RepID=UPI0036D9A7CF
MGERTCYLLFTRDHDEAEEEQSRDTLTTSPTAGSATTPPADPLEGPVRQAPRLDRACKKDPLAGQLHGPDREEPSLRASEEGSVVDR